MGNQLFIRDIFFNQNGTDVKQDQNVCKVQHPVEIKVNTLLTLKRNIVFTFYCSNNGRMTGL